MPLSNGKKYYLTGSKFPASNFLQGIDSASVSIKPGNSTSTTVFTIAKNASGSYWEMTGSSTAGNVSSTIKPTNAGPTASIGDAWVIGPLFGAFNTGVWTVQLGVVAGSNATRGKFNLRMLKGTNLSASNALGFSTGQVWGTTIAVPNTTSASFVTASFNLTASLPFANEYLFIQSAWGETTAGGNSNATNISVIQGSGSFITMSAFEDTAFMIWNHDDNPGFSGIP